MKIIIIVTAILVSLPSAMLAENNSQKEMALQGLVRIEKFKKNIFLVKLKIVKLSKDRKISEIITGSNLFIEFTGILKTSMNNTKSNMRSVYNGEGKNLVASGYIIEVQCGFNEINIFLAMIVNRKPYVIYFKSPLKLNENIEFFNFLPEGWDSKVFLTPKEILKVKCIDKKSSSVH